MNEAGHNKTQQTRVDFYLLAGTNTQGIQHFCCRLAEKAWKLGNTVFIRTEDEQQARLLDNLMWTYSDGFFLPHTTSNDVLSSETPIIIGSKTEPAQAFDLLINLASDIPGECSHYLRIAEIINENETIKTHGRVRYGQYTKKNYPLNHHNISA